MYVCSQNSCTFSFAVAQTVHDYVWISNGRELERVEGVTGESLTNNLTVYTEYYIILKLSITDNNSLYACKVIVNTSPLMSATGSITLDVIGKFTV